MASLPEEIAVDVYCLKTGRGFMQANVYFVRTGDSWVLIDTAWPWSGRSITRAAETLFGKGARPAEILLTHMHPDHSGSALELARQWNVPVYVLAEELPLTAGDMPTLERYPSGLLDRWFLFPLMHVLPPKVREAALTRNAALKALTRELDPGAGVPGLPGWVCVPAPGHTPGQVTFFRESDRVLISGDAVTLYSPTGMLSGGRHIAPPSYISSWNWAKTKQSVAALADLEPRVLASGHGAPRTEGAALALRAFAQRFAAPRGTAETVAASASMAAHVSTTDRLLFALRVTGVPIGIFALRRLGRAGGLLMEGAISALAARAVALVAGGAPRRLRLMPRLLLFVEMALDGLTGVAGFWAWVWNPFVRPALAARGRARGGPRSLSRQRQPAKSTIAGQVTSLAVASWMAATAVHALRMAIYISPGRGLRQDLPSNAHSVEDASRQAG